MVINNGLLINFLRNEKNNSTWNTVALPCAYKQWYHFFAGIHCLTNSASGNAANKHENSTVTTLVYGTRDGTTNFRTYILCIGY